MREIFRGRLVHLCLEEVELPNGERVTLEVVRHPGASAVIAVDAERHVILLRQFRPVIGDFIWEIPAGIVEEGELPLECARRELEEETGLRAAQWTHLGSVLTAPGFCDERIELFLALDLTAGEQHLDRDEVLSVSRVPLAEALAMVVSGDICDAKSVAGLHHAWVRFYAPSAS